MMSEMQPCVVGGGGTAASKRADCEQAKGKQKTAFMFVRQGNQISICAAEASDIKSICNNLPSPSHSVKYEQILKSHTRYAQLTGPDFRVLRLRTLGDNVTKTEKIDVSFSENRQ